jgi:hypothetical protein
MFYSFTTAKKISTRVNRSKTSEKEIERINISVLISFIIPLAKYKKKAMET